MSSAQKRGDSKSARNAYDNAMSLIIGSPIQAEMVLDEAHELGFQGTDPMAVIQHLDELRKRVSTK